MDRLLSMGVFVKAVELGSFAAAATACGISAPMAGKHIRSLEAHLGATLVHRTTRKMALSDLGRAYFERCKAVLSEAHAADAMVKDHLGAVRGTLRITLPVIYGRMLIAPLLVQLATKHPTLDLVLSFSDRPSDLLREGYDLSVRSGLPADGGGLISRKLAEYPMVVCAAPDYASTRPLQEPAQLADHHGIFYSRSGRPRPWRFPREGGAELEVMPRKRLLLDDLQSIVDATEAGMGFACLPRWIVEDRLEAGRLVPVLTDHAALRLSYFLVWPEAQFLPLRTRVAIDAIARQLAA
ncbi:LysR family transcriptional regulator [Bradyrhizobium tropiciagri]|uniref:LysR family transcriptional regulator n=1 Tax=Bradyrhizobium tropiciagri TaxID=312253 RepID=UPI001BADCB9F|nr:LysR family transcriptional regulator [Bradyrhizobium tropiciagri]MBR0899560.1 LysR family transcriptional regulator [Bradyrhizobium tropiciagri]